MAVISGVTANRPIVGNEIDSDYFAFDSNNLLVAKPFSTGFAGLAPKTGNVPDDYVLNCDGNWTKAPPKFDGFQAERAIGDQVLIANTSLVMSIATVPFPQNDWMLEYHYQSLVLIKKVGLTISLPNPQSAALAEAMIGQIIVLRATGFWVGNYSTVIDGGNLMIDGDRSNITFTKPSNGENTSNLFMWGGDTWYTGVGRS